MKLKFSDFEVIPIIDTVRQLEMTDEEYFSPKYGKYVSNSRLNLINPKRGGSPESYIENAHTSTNSLNIGSAVHEILLQPESFNLAPKMGKPSAKLGEVIDQIYNNRQKGMSIYDSIIAASQKVGYFVNTIDKKIPMIIEKGLQYYVNLSTPRTKYANKEEIILNDKDYDTVTGCLESCYENHQIMDYLHPKDTWGDDIQSRCEDALFIDFLVTYKDKQCSRIKFKLKIDNWTIDFENKKITLNDLKTSSKNLDYFMNREFGSFTHYNYYRQLYVYSAILWYYCQKKYGVSKEAGWSIDCNILAVQTTDDFKSRRFNIGRDWLKMGKIEFEMLMKRVAALDIFDTETQIDFI